MIQCASTEPQLYMSTAHYGHSSLWPALCKRIYLAPTPSSGAGWPASNPSPGHQCTAGSEYTGQVIVYSGLEVTQLQILARY